MQASKMFAAIVAFLLMSAGVAADTFVMRDGRLLSGEFIGSTARSAHLRTASGVERYLLSEVRTIRLEPRPPSGHNDVSLRSNSGAPRALIVGQGQAQVIERASSSN